VRILVIAFVVAAPLAAADGFSVLQQRCLQCHNAQTTMSGLRLDDRDAALKGGTRGAAIAPGDSASSLVYRAVSHTAEPAMPPTGKLSDKEVAAVAAWINEGAPWAEESAAAEAPTWWAFQKPVKPDVPSGADHPIDAFIQAKLAENDLTPAEQADRATLIRRLSFDLHGLPPSAEEVEAFVNDATPDAWGRLVDRMLASPRYGEKWGRHWLDLVRYGDTSGFEQDPYILEAWRFRDYVIQSFNDDKPYDRFVKEQLAGDEIWPDEPEARSGTAYYRVNANRDMLFKVDDINRVEKLTDFVDTTSKAFLALSVGCARCHDHKFDPIPQRDFYRMQAVFAPAVNEDIFLEYNQSRFHALSWNTRDFKLRGIADHLRAVFNPYSKKIRNERLRKLPDGEEAIVAFDVPRDKRTTRQEELVTLYEDEAKVSNSEVYAALSPADRERVETIERTLVGLFKNYKSPMTVPGVIDGGREAPRTYVAVRGNPDVPGEEVGPGYLSALGGGDIPDPPEHATTTYRRKHLAEWIASPENPLTARVMVNRIWQHHFGAPIVADPSDFGVRATDLSHPKLLDWLAVKFVDEGWSMKAMHRLILSSDAYQRSSVSSAKAREVDPTNRYLSHFNRRRLQAGEIRDAVLHASGSLNLEMGGEPVVVPLDKEELYGITGNPNDRWVVSWDPKQHDRRSIYLLQRRAFQQPMFQVFDAPDGMVSCSRRNESTTAPQSLTLLNSRFMTEQAKRLAERISGVDDAWRMAFARSPSDAEREMADSFLKRQLELRGTKKAALGELARSLLNSNEFLYVD